MKVGLFMLLLVTFAAGMPQEMRISIAYGNGRFVAVMGSRILNSMNGVQWNETVDIYRASQSYFTSVTFGNGKFVAVGIYGRPYDSKENSSFQPIAGAVLSVPYEGLNSVAFGANQFVAVGIRGKILVSFDAITWKESVTGFLDNLTSVMYSSGRFVATGSNGVILTSSDGNHWTKTQINQAFVFSTITAGINGNVITNRGQIYNSGDLSGWKLNDVKIDFPIYSCMWGDNLFVVVGKKGLILTSPDGNTWQASHVDTTVTMRAACYGNGKYVALDSCFAVTSQDGFHWEETKWR